MYVRLNIIVEGQTEETFVNLTLKPHLSRFSIGVSARVVTTKKERGTKYRGGLSTYFKAKRDITLWIKQDRNPDVRFTTMFDLYGLPPDFPATSRRRQETIPTNGWKLWKQPLAMTSLISVSFHTFSCTNSRH